MDAKDGLHRRIAFASNLIQILSIGNRFKAESNAQQSESGRLMICQDIEFASYLFAPFREIVSRLPVFQLLFPLTSHLPWSQLMVAIGPEKRLSGLERGVLRPRLFIP